MAHYDVAKSVNLSVSWYNVAIIWAMQTLIYPLWRVVPTRLFGDEQARHLRWLFLVVFPPATLATALAVVLERAKQPPVEPRWATTAGLGIQLGLWGLTAAMWGRWQARIAVPVNDSPPQLGPANTRLSDLLRRTHWLRVALVTVYAVLASLIARSER